MPSGQKCYDGHELPDGVPGTKLESHVREVGTKSLQHLLVGVEHKT